MYTTELLPPMNTPFCPLPTQAAQPTARGALRRRWRTQLAAAALIGAASIAALPLAQAQVVNPLGAMHNFPDAAERGTLTILGVQDQLKRPRHPHGPRHAPVQPAKHTGATPHSDRPDVQGGLRA